MNKILIVVGFTLVAVVFFILGIRLMSPSGGGNEVKTTPTPPTSEKAPVAVGNPHAADQEGPWFDISPVPSALNTWTFSLNEPVKVELKDCNDTLFPTDSPYIVDFGDGSSASLTAEHTGYAIEGGFCSLFWGATHEYTLEGTHEIKLMKDNVQIETKQVIVG